MIEVIHESNPIARKGYQCNACEFVMDAYSDGWFTFAELREIVKARKNGFNIAKGQEYIRQFNKYSGDTWTFRAIPAIHEICIKYDMYDML